MGWGEAKRASKAFSKAKVGCFVLLWVCVFVSGRLEDDDDAPK